MATHFKDNASIDSVAETTDAIATALESDTVTSDLAPIWRTISGEADELSADRRQLQRAARRARARLDVCDGLWDDAAAAFGRSVVDETDGRRDQPPYTRFFSKTTPSKAQRFGIQREIALGRQWLTELARNPGEILAETWIPRLTQATDELETAADARDAAVRALVPQRTTIVLFIDEVNHELDRLEGELRQIFAGAQDRVRSFLSATHSSRRAGAPEDEMSPSSDA